MRPDLRTVLIVLLGLARLLSVAPAGGEEAPVVAVTAERLAAGALDLSAG